MRARSQVPDVGEDIYDRPILKIVFGIIYILKNKIDPSVVASAPSSTQVMEILRSLVEQEFAQHPISIAC